MRKWIGYTPANRLEGGEVKHCRDLVSFDYVLDKTPVAHIAILADHLLAADARQALQHPRVTIGEIIKDYRHVPSFSNGEVCMASYVTSTARNKDVHNCAILTFAPTSSWWRKRIFGRSSCPKIIDR